MTRLSQLQLAVTIEEMFLEQAKIQRVTLNETLRQVKSEITEHIQPGSLVGVPHELWLRYYNTLRLITWGERRTTMIIRATALRRQVGQKQLRDRHNLPDTKRMDMDRDIILVMFDHFDLPPYGADF
ncbi:hypothetical protein N7495_007978 [Penicillium taxi]|uniref:uncharacterized protein n=1 Tax=Penicillium taxi TaxID=168475 RepID=UPI0025451C06|nr:uncharacterized protein N7495_007978 [Penicillium taxi]KAJ5887937.1 hypothetical protein N7495_007978 [Penicillium taxi]